jgi:hypothetical protein
MKRTPLIATLIITCGIAVLCTACQQAAPSANSPNTANANAAPKEQPVNTAAIESELLQLEHEWSTAAVKRSPDIIQRMEADDIVITYPDGTTGSKSDDMRDIETGALSAEGWDLADLKVRVLNADTAVVTGRGIIKNGKYKGSDGKIQALKPEYRFTDVFQRRNGRWQCVATQSTTIANPTPATSTKPSPSPASSSAPAK